MHTLHIRVTENPLNKTLQERRIIVLDKNPVEIVCKLISDESRITDEEREAMVDILYHSDEDYLAHYGISGMRKGVRRWTNEDGTLTEAGKEHYGIGASQRQVRNDAEEARRVWAMNKLNAQDAKTKLDRMQYKAVVRSSEGKTVSDNYAKKIEKQKKLIDDYNRTAANAVRTTLEIANSRTDIKLRDRVYYDKVRSGTEVVRQLFGGVLFGAPKIKLYSRVMEINDHNGVPRIEVDDFNIKRT